MNILTYSPSPCTHPITRHITILYQPTLSPTLSTYPLNPSTKVPIDKSPLRAMARGSQIACAIIAVLLQLGHWKATRNLATEPRPAVLTGETLDRRKRP